jgi:hypothetical protein
VCSCVLRLNQHLPQLFILSCTADPDCDPDLQDLLVPTIHLSREFSQSPLQGHPPHRRNILLFLRGDVGQHRSARGDPSVKL